VIGDFEKEEMLDHLTALFQDQKPGQAPTPPVVNLADVKPVHASLKRPVQVSYIAMGKSTVGLGHPDVAVLDVLADVLSGGVSSRFYQSLREEKQMALSVSCDFMPYEQKGLFAFFIEALPDRALKAKAELLKELKDVAAHPFRQEELDRARARIKSEWLHGSETPHGQASTLGELAVKNHIDLVSTYLSRIEALTPKDLMRAFDEHLSIDQFFVTELHPDT
jgi:predicted Zn-dependent peptidase